LDICEEWTKDDIISDILDSDNYEVEDPQIQPTKMSKKAKLALETLRKYSESNEGMKD